MTHIVIYVPGLGDTNLNGRRLIVAGWRLYGVRPVVHQMNWADAEPFAPKLQRLLKHIDELVAAGNQVSLVGESAGASAVMHAYAVRQDAVHRVACICGKLRHPETIHPATYQHNPTFQESMQLLATSIANIRPERINRIRSVHPLRDQTVPIADTFVEGAESKTIPSIGHATSIVLGDTLFAYTLIGFLKQK